MKVPAALLIVLSALPRTAASSSEAGDCLEECGGDADCEAEMTGCLLKTGKARQAVEHLKPVVEMHPAEPAFARLLALAYLADGNSFWAQRTLQETIARNKGDCESLSLLAWAHIIEGDFDLAHEALSRHGCPDNGPEQARWALLRSFAARMDDDHEAAAAALEKAAEAGRIYPEDEDTRLFLKRQYDPAWIEPMTASLALSGGYTTNAGAGSPLDPAVRGLASALSRLDLFGRFVLPAFRAVQPSLEGGLRGLGVAEASARSLNYLELFARPGLILGSGFPRVLVGYRADQLLVNHETETRFYIGHRGELEVETGGPMFFLGAGRRLFQESGRTRIELDGGMGGSFHLTRRINLLLACSLRHHEAVGDPYDLIGGTALMAGKVDIEYGVYARFGATAALDRYPLSGGERGEAAFGTHEKRRDVAGMVSAELWSPPWLNTRAGASYEISIRDSTADDAGSSYDYTEHRLLLKMRWAFDLDPWAPRKVKPAGHAALDYGIAEGAGTAAEREERIMDMLRQDETLRASSCGCKR